MKITLICGADKLSTTCTGVSKQIYNRYIVHGLSKKGREWVAALPEDHEAIFVHTSRGREKLDYVSSDPLP